MPIKKSVRKNWGFVQKIKKINGIYLNPTFSIQNLPRYANHLKKGHNWLHFALGEKISLMSKIKLQHVT